MDAITLLKYGPQDVESLFQASFERPRDRAVHTTKRQLADKIDQGADHAAYIEETSSTPLARQRGAGHRRSRAARSIGKGNNPVVVGCCPSSRRDYRPTKRFNL